MEIRSKISVPLELDEVSLMKELHASSIIVCEYGAKGLEPLNTDDHIGTTNGQYVEVHQK